MTNSLPILERLFHHECRSLAQYVGESWPWEHRGDSEAHELARSIMADERRWAEQLAELITQRGGVPRMGSYPAAFTHSNLHFLALDFLLDRLADFIAQAIVALRADLSATANDSSLNTPVGQMIERKSGQVEALRKLAARLGQELGNAAR